jgi:nitroimidazol reductase NimA-like FMN-containing flavoprotein (pyridoxamine 5'-phosphate oxidase superfamily)
MAAEIRAETRGDDTHPSERTRVRRRAERGRYDRATVHAILDEGLVCHVGFAIDGQPFVIPTAHARDGETLYLHGSPASRMLRNLSEGVPVCVTVTLLDGVVLARSAFHHSMNYRSVVLLGTATEVDDPAEKRAAFRALVEHVAPGRYAAVRPPTDYEVTGTLVLRLPIDEGSAKVRTGPPIDDEADYGLPVWAGVIPLALRTGAPIPDPRLDPEQATPRYAVAYARG